MRPLLILRTREAKGISPDYERLWQEVSDLYKAGGKRLRSYMTLLAYEMYSPDDLNAILPAAAAQELLHLSMLIHDDIIDRDLLRYGKENITARYLRHYERNIHEAAERLHYANSAALLAGNLLISEAYILMTQTEVDPKAILRAQQMVSQSVFHVIGGELLDTEATFRGDKASDPLKIAEQKTASYSFVSPFLVGATLAGAPQDQLHILQTLGETLGVAYQLRDDIMGVFGNESKTGKSAEGDIREGKRTVLIEEFLKRASTEDLELFRKAFAHRDASSKDVRAVKALIETSGARAAVESLIENGRQKALTILETLAIDDDHKKTFEQLIELALKRTA